MDSRTSFGDINEERKVINNRHPRQAIALRRAWTDLTANPVKENGEKKSKLKEKKRNLLNSADPFVVK